MAIEKVITVAPRSFCAGVARSIKVVEDCLELFGAPIYIKHAIVHNKTVTAELAEKGAITVEDVADIPEGATAVFSAHGSPPEHYEQAAARGICVIDATCPLVTKVHIEAARYAQSGYKMVYVGHRGHIEGIGVMASAKKHGGEVQFVDTIQDVDDLTFSTDDQLALLTQTTLNIDDTMKIIAKIKQRYLEIAEPGARDICYATTNRQNAITELAKKVDVVLVFGSVTSSNSNRLVEVAQSAGARAYLLDDISELNASWLEGTASVGISAGASAPERLVEAAVAHFVAQGAEASSLQAIEERMQFTEPLELTAARKATQGA